MPIGKLSLNPMKCAFCIKSGMLFGHIVSVEGIAMDLVKVEMIGGTIFIVMPMTLLCNLQCAIGTILH